MSVVPGGNSEVSSKLLEGGKLEKKNSPVRNQPTNEHKLRNYLVTLLHLKWITNKDLLYSTGNFAQCYSCLDGWGV